MSAGIPHGVQAVMAGAVIGLLIWAVVPIPARGGPKQESIIPAKEMANGPQSAQEQAIRTSAGEFTRAFNAGRAQAIAALLTPDCDYADEVGNIYHGRNEIEKEYADFFAANPGATIELRIDSIRLPSPETAIEDGTATVRLPDGPVSTSQYRVVHVRQNGRWLMTSIRDSMNETPSHYANLKDLEWLIGNWVAKGEGRDVHTTFRWMDNKNFIQRIFTVRKKDGVTATGTQVIGWDPGGERVVSWTFDSTGGYGHGVWRPLDNGWSIASTGVMPDGTPVTSTEISSRTDDNHFTWQSTDRTVQGMQLPDTEKIVVERVRGAK